MSAAADARREEVLAALVRAGDAGVSGEALAAQLGCSRAAVHRHVEALRRQGLRVTGEQEGYRLDPGADPVVPALVVPRLAPPLAGPVRWRVGTGSTNDDLTDQLTDQDDTQAGDHGQLQNGRLPHITRGHCHMSIAAHAQRHCCERR